MAPGSGPTGSATGERFRAGSANSDLPDLPLRFNDDYAFATGQTSVRRKPSLSNQDLTALRRDKDREREREDHDPYAYGVEVMGSQRATSQRGMRRFDSPIEMVDRSRPW